MGEIAINPIHNVHKKYRTMNLVNPYWFVPITVPFTSSWKTDNVSTGSSTSTQVKLPIHSGGTYNFVVNWGDGNSNTITVWNDAAVTHTYGSVGTYTITITGVCTGWAFGNTGDRLKLLNITNWGTIKLGNTGGYFNGCANLNLSSVAGTLNLTGMTTLTSFFQGCTALTTVAGMSSWNTSSITSMTNTFYTCTNFNQDLSSWNTSAVTAMGTMFYGCTNFNNGLANGVAGTLPWNTSSCSAMISMFDSCSKFNQDVSSFNVSLVPSFNAMFQNCSKFNNGGSSGIGSWTLKTTGTVSLASIFQSCTLFNQNLNGWNTIAVNIMSNTFLSCTNFNNGLADGVSGTMTWNTSAVTTFSSTFQSCSKFNQDVSGFTVNLATTLANMFNACAKFNNGGSSGIGSWTLKTTGTVSLAGIFANCTIFNQPLSWNTVAVNNISYMFYLSPSFNNGLASGVAGTLSFNTSLCTDFTSIFQNCVAFNQDISGFNVSLVTTFTGMFQGATNFNNGGSSGIGSWTLKTTGTVNLSSMFYLVSAFNQPLSWNTIAVTTMASMFRLATTYNQAISFNTIAVTDMNNMFNGATAFQQNLGALDVRNVANFSNFMLGKTPATFPSTYLDNIYNGWSTLPSLKPSITITFGTAKYTAAASVGRAILTGAPNNWVIIDGGI